MNKAIYTPSTPVNLENPFDMDSTQSRRRLAEKLNDVVSRMKSGGVISVEAQWGDGKSWFAQNWLGNMKNELHRKAALIDAFSNDFVDDPYSVISAELLTLLPMGNGPDKELKAKLCRVGGMLIQASGKAVVKAVVKHTIGETAGSELASDIDDAISDPSAEFVDRIIGEQITALQSARASISSLKSKLAKLAKDDGPIVILIDELDRCKPDFAVRTLERIKHFFDVPGLIFVLFINRKAMVSAINGVYGLGEQLSEGYLTKFIHLSVSLPVLREPVNSQSIGDLERYWDACYARYHDAQDRIALEFRDAFCSMASRLGMSFRDIERAITLYLFSDRKVRPSTVWLAWPILCKIYQPTTFAQIRSGKFTDTGAEELISSVRRNNSEDRMLSTIASAHRVLAGGATDSLSDDLERMGGHPLDRVIKDLFEAVDL
ncbi:MAG: P-loop NTPase fold protein [Aquabacterium sp.]